MTTNVPNPATFTKTRHREYWESFLSVFHVDFKDIESHRRVWTTSDLHFEHKGAVIWRNMNLNLFRDVEHMNEHLIEMWNSVVAPCDLVIHIGDFSFARKTRTQDIIDKLNGTILFIEGNHDYVLPKLDVIRRKYFEFKFHGQLVCLFHYPILSWNCQSSGSIHLFGHMHGQLSNFYNRKMGRAVDVAWDKHHKMLDLFALIKHTNKTQTVSRNSLLSWKARIAQWLFKFKSKKA